MSKLARVLLRLSMLATCIGSVFSLCSGQSNPPPANSIQRSGTYSQTIQSLSAWDADSGEDEQLLSAFFAKGEVLSSDLVAVCDSGDEDLATKAYLLLRLIRNAKTAECARRLHPEDPPVVLGTSDEVTPNEFAKLEYLFRTRSCEESVKCAQTDLPLVDESLVYALVLDGSQRSRNLLNRMSRLAKASNSQDMLGFDVASRAETLIARAREQGHNLKFEPNTFEQVFRQSAFFLPDDNRGTAEIRLLARNMSDDRMLVAVSYSCGRLCGSGYYVVLRRYRGNTWEYALIMRAWIS